MKAFLLYRDRDFDVQQALPPNEGALTQDLELDLLCNAMAGGDRFLFDVAKRALLASLTDPEAIRYRQQVLADCIEQSATVRSLYDVAVGTLQAERQIWGLWGRESPDIILHRAIQVLELFVKALKQLRQISDGAAERFRSEGFVRFFAMLSRELDDAYFQTVGAHLRALRFPHGVVISAELGQGNKGTGYVLRQPRQPRWIERLVPRSAPAGYSFRIADRDESGFQALDQLRGRGINLVANALTQASDHILSFFTLLRAELAFYVGCLNLRARLVEKGEPTCIPIPMAPDGERLTAEGLYDVCLALQVPTRAVGNALDANGKSLVFMTGANQGGKSTMLRAIGLAHLMLQCGLFVGATAFAASVCSGIFTHFKREEDASMQHGKLAEELSRMSAIADLVTPHAIILCNESFASTNEREGSEIARQVIRAFTEAEIRVVFVTHLFDLAHSFYVQGLDSALFLRAARLPDGQRTFELIEGEPLPTSFGEDTYAQVFGSAGSPPSS